MVPSHRLDINIRTPNCSSQSVISVSDISLGPGICVRKTAEMSGMGVFVLMIVAMCATWRAAVGAAFHAPLHSETTMYGWRPVTTQYCEWQGKKMMVESSWKTTSCETCSCEENGLYCYGGGVYAVPSHCMMLIDETCHAHVVDAEHPYSECEFGNGAITG
ncbi:uncharacterized protein LOC118427661 isoform X2 [Branchiostoma floridae]|uniref:Uncharacterized protein LOC118427661 isoform X2 n=2 Tax=Branchiostoma floridae TaxID=7739 RepID=A0A9J7M2W1_BRAFL|nr:uncharacterized protein LOC118427661 isoform X2 [Branchiostoma floridae]